MKRVLLDDGLDVGSTLAHSKDDPAITRDLSTRDQEVSGSVVLLQKVDMRGHVGIDFGEADLVDEFDDEHGRPACLKHTVA